MKRNDLYAEPGKQETVITQEFPAPREIIFKIFTEPMIIPQWWGPRYLTTTVDKQELIPGGSWRFVQRDTEGNVHCFHGVYHEIDTDNRMVYTFEYEGTPGHVILETVTFEDIDGGTRITEQAVFQSVADRDEMVQAGMEVGTRESFERINELLVTYLTR
jgi:uncharacterized protein YndB with AHSA1/START domain